MGARILLDLDLGRLEREGGAPGPSPWQADAPGLARVGSWGGSALGLALLAREAEAGRAPPLVLSAGDAVRRALPTAARLSVMGRAPRDGRWVEGYVGGGLGPNLAAWADALVLRGRTGLAGAVLRIDAHGTARLEARPELVGCAPGETWQRLGCEAPAAVLSVGPAGERGLPFACLAGGGARPSFVARGGLGAVFGSLGLKALVLEGAPGDAPSARPEGAHALLRALAASPRLLARGEGGSFELFEALGARDPAWREQGPRLAREARESGVERKGCRGCPTPCGWLFERQDGERQRAHFNAGRALGSELGLERFDDALVLLAACDAVGVDAREAGAILRLLCIAHERGRLPGAGPRGDRAALARAIGALVEDGPGSAGAGALARELGIDDVPAPGPGGAASDAALLARHVATGGADPMHAFPFLVEASGRAGLERLCADLGPLPPGAEDPGDPAGKGRLVYWHENLSAAVDATGFCAFSSAGLLADGVCDLDQLAAWILPAELGAPDDADWARLDPGQRLLAAGANLVLLRRELDRQQLTDGVLPADADEARRLAQEGMLPEYRRFRGALGAGRALGTPGALAPAQPVAPGGPSPTAEGATAARGPRSSGGVELRAAGALGEALGDGVRRLELELPCSVGEVLAAAAARDERLLDLLFQGGRPGAPPIPSVWRAGRPLDPGASVAAGDVLELVSVIGGG